MLEKILVDREPVIQEFLGMIQFNGPSRHCLVSGPHGIGKTFLLKLIEHRVQKKPEFKRDWEVVALYGKSYTTYKIVDLFRCILKKGTESSSIFEPVDNPFPNQNQCTTEMGAILTALRERFRTRGIRVLAILDHFDDLVQQLKVRSEFRHFCQILSEEKWLTVLGASESFKDPFVHPETTPARHFTLISLDELAPDSRLLLMRKLDSLNNAGKTEVGFDDICSRLFPLFYFVPGYPRMTIILYELYFVHGITEPFLLLSRFLDRLTPFYQHNLENQFSAQERRLFTILALAGKGCTPRELAQMSGIIGSSVRTVLIRMLKKEHLARYQQQHQGTLYFIHDTCFRLWIQFNHSYFDRGSIEDLLEFFSDWRMNKDDSGAIWSNIYLQDAKQLHASHDYKFDDFISKLDYVVDTSLDYEECASDLDELKQRLAADGVDDLCGVLTSLDLKYAGKADYFLLKGALFGKGLGLHGFALEAFEIALNQGKETIFNLFNRAVALAKLGEKAEAKQAFQVLANFLIPEQDAEKKQNLLLKLLQTEEDSSKLRILSYLIAQSGNTKFVQDIIAILGRSKSIWKQGACVQMLGLLGDQSSAAIIVDLLQSGPRLVRSSAAQAAGWLQATSLIDALCISLTDEAATVRSSAAEALGRIGTEQAVAALLKCLNDEISTVRSSAAEALGRIGTEQAVAALLKCLNDEISTVRSSAAEALGRIGAEQAVAALLKCLNDEASVVRSDAVTALGLIGDPKAVTALIKCLKQSDWITRSHAATALGNFGFQNTIGSLIQCLLSDDEITKSRAAIALGKLNAKEAVPVLTDCFVDQGTVVQQAIVQALGLIGSPFATLALTEHVNSKHLRVRKAIIIALGEIGGIGVAATLASCLRNNSGGIRYEAVKALGKFTDESTLNDIIGCLKDPNVDVREQAIITLGNFQSARSAEALVGVLEGDHVRMSQLAARSLGHIGSENTVMPLERKLQDHNQIIRKAVAAALLQIMPAKQIDNFMQLTEVTLKEYDAHPLEFKRFISRRLLRLAFRCATKEEIQHLFSLLKSFVNEQHEFFMPYLVASESLEVDQDSKVIASYQPEMHQAALLLVNEYQAVS